MILLFLAFCLTVCCMPSIIFKIFLYYLITFQISLFIVFGFRWVVFTLAKSGVLTQILLDCFQWRAALGFLLFLGSEFAHFFSQRFRFWRWDFCNYFFFQMVSVFIDFNFILVLYFLSRLAINRLQLLLIPPLLGIRLQPHFCFLSFWTLIARVNPEDRL